MTGKARGKEEEEDSIVINLAPLIYLLCQIRHRIKYVHVSLLISMFV